MQPLESRALLSVALSEAGWTVITPESGSRVIYVSSSSGDNDNDGRSPNKPVKNLSHAQSLIRNDSGDQMLLKRGDVWKESLNGWWKSGKSDQQPIVIGAYGSGGRPLLLTGDKDGFNAGSAKDSPVNHVSILGLSFVAHTRLPGPDFAGSGEAIGIRLLGPADDFRVEDCFIKGYTTNVIVQHFFGDISDVALRRNVIADAYAIAGVGHSQGVYVDGVDRLLLEENVIDHNGWNESLGASTAPTPFNHNLYIRENNTDVVIRGNVIARAASHGLQARAGGQVQDNLFLDNNIGMSFGLVNGAPATPGGVGGNVTGNIFLGGGDGIIDSVPRGWALEIGNTRPGAGVTVADNIFAGDGSGKSSALILGMGSGVENFSESVGINDLTIRNNIFNRWHQGLFVSWGFEPGQTGPKGLKALAVRENDFQQLGSEAFWSEVPVSSASETFTANRYDGGKDGKPDIVVTRNYVSWDKWKKEHEPTGKSMKVAYPDAARSAEKYSAATGGESTLAGLIYKMREQSSQNWRQEFTSGAVVSYVRAGFGKGPPSAPPPPPAGDPPTTPSTPVETPPTPAPVNPDPPPSDPNAPPAPGAPVVTADLPDQMKLTAGEAALTFSVTYSDPDTALDVGTIDAGDLRVLGKKGFDEPATLVSVQVVADNVAVATYAVSQPDGPWERADKGMYTIVSNADQVRDAGGAAVPAAEIAEFKVTIAKPPPPDKPPIVKRIRFAPRGASSVTVFFSEDVSASIQATDLYLIGEDGSRAIAPELMAVSYDAEKNAATWTFPGLPEGTLPKAKYHLIIAGWGLTDSATQMLDGNRDGESGDDFAPARWFRA